MSAHHESEPPVPMFLPLPAPPTNCSIVHPPARLARASLWQLEQPVDQGLDAPVSVVATLARAILETLSGRRPLGQLSAWLSQDAVAMVVALARVRRWESVRFRAARARVPRRGVIEGVILLDLNGRVVAATTRIHRQQNSWICTHFNLLESAGVTQALRAA